MLYGQGVLWGETMKVKVTQVLYVIQAKSGSDSWIDTPYDLIETLRAARNTLEVLNNGKVEGWSYRIVKQIREVIA